MTNPENNLQMKWLVEERKLHGMAKVDHFLEIWGGSQGLSATQKESRTQNTQMAAVGYILDTQEIVKVSWSNYEHDGGLHLNCRKDHICHQLCVQRTSLEDQLKL